MARVDSPYHRQPPPGESTSRRDFLRRSGGGLGGIALATLLAEERAVGGVLHHPAKAKRVVQLFMAGAASHIDLFDEKPELARRHGQKADFGESVETFQDGLGPWLRPIWKFAPHGRSGKRLGEVVADLGDCVDDMAFVHNMVGKSGVHSSATLLQSTGFLTPGFPGAGAWVSYGLGSLNENLPTFVVLPDHRGFASNGPKNWDSAFLPAQHQGTAIYPGAAEPVAYLRAPANTFLSPEGDAAGLELLGSLNRDHAAHRGGDARLEARIKSYELAARMQLAAPEALDISREPAHVLKLYGLDHGKSSFDREINAVEEIDAFGRKCLVARRLLERGVRFVQVWSGNDNGYPRRNWDSHEDVERDHGPLARGMARGASALLKDLKQRGMLDDTIILWTTEFGRMPSSAGGQRDVTTTRSSSRTGWPAAGSRGDHPRTQRRVRLQAPRPRPPHPGLRYPRHDPPPPRDRPHPTGRPSRRDRPAAHRRPRPSHPRDPRLIPISPQEVCNIP